jgi:hypothetical protein
VGGLPFDGRLARAQHEAALAMIKWHLRHQPVPTTNASFLEWFNERAGK